MQNQTIRSFYKPFAACACALALAACAAAPLTEQSKPADAAALLKGKWMMCQDGIDIRQTISQNSRDTVTLKFTHAEQYEQSDCTGAVKQSIGTKEFLEKMGLQKGNFNYKLKINDLKNQGNAFTAPVTVFSSVQAKMKTEDKNLNIEGEGTSEGVLHIQADGSEFEMEMGNSRMKLIRAK